MNVTPSTSVMTRGLTPHPAVRTAAAAVSSAPPDSADSAIDFSRIDTPQEAALMPALNAASFLLHLNAITSAATGHFGVTSSVQMAMGEKDEARIDYKMPDPSTLTYEGRGTMAGLPIEETWTYDSELGGWSIGGQIGERFENLLLTQNPDGSLFLHGTVDHVKVVETITQQPDGNTVTFSGRIGSDNLQQTLTFGFDDRGYETVHVEGALGGRPISFNQSVQPDGALVKSSVGEGLIAGTPVHLTNQMTLTSVSA